MTDGEAYVKLRAHGVTRIDALWLLTYAHQAQRVGGWSKLVITSRPYPWAGGSEGAKERAMDIFRDAGIDPMAIRFPREFVGESPLRRN